MCGVELVADKSTKAPALGLGVKVAREAMARGLCVRARPGSADPAIGDTLCLSPPLSTRSKSSTRSRRSCADVDHRRDAVKRIANFTRLPGGFPAKAGTYASADRAPDKWVPAFAGKAVLFSRQGEKTEERMPTRNIGIVVEGATGRLGATQHLKALMAIRTRAGSRSANGDRLVPDPVLLGRDPGRLAALAACAGRPRMEHDRDAACPTGHRDLFRRDRDRRPGRARARGVRRRQARLSRKADRREPGRSVALAAPRNKPAGRTASCRTNCSCPV